MASGKDSSGQDGNESTPSPGEEGSSPEDSASDWCSTQRAASTSGVHSPPAGDSRNRASGKRSSPRTAAQRSASATVRPGFAPTAADGRNSLRCAAGDSASIGQ